jgi:hypothetical protein
MKDEWVDYCLMLAGAKAHAFVGGRKIIRGRKLDFETYDDSDLVMADAGYTKSKMRYLERGYLHEESRSVAMDLWKRRLGMGSYGSVGFTTYNHFIKNDPNNKSKVASVMGPCIQSVTLTLVDKKTIAVDVFYRTTELFKKFPADLVFLKDVLLEPFDLPAVSVVRCHFANITIHPMYFVTVLPHIEDPVHYLKTLAIRDPYFHGWVVKWSARYLCEEYSKSIAKYAQAQRVRRDAQERIDRREMKELRDYFRANYPGRSNDEEEDIDED